MIRGVFGAGAAPISMHSKQSQSSTPVASISGTLFCRGVWVFLILLFAPFATNAVTLDEMLCAQTVALQAQPGNAALWQARGQTRLKLEDTVGALEDYSEAVRLDPFKVDYRLSRARLLADRGAWSEVVADTTSGLAVSPAQVDLLVLRARARSNLDQLDTALGDADRAIALIADNPDARAVRAEIHLLRHEWPEALADAAVALQRRPDDIDLLSAQGIAHREKHCQGSPQFQPGRVGGNSKPATANGTLGS
jgi:tetratricopeptide (TPR) repeat protein